MVQVSQHATADYLRFDVELTRDEVAQLLIEGAPVDVVTHLTRGGLMIEVRVTVAADN